MFHPRTACLVISAILVSCVTTAPADPPTPEGVNAYLEHQMKVAIRENPPFYDPITEIPRFIYPPVIRTGYGTTDEDIRSLRAAIGILNSALPGSFQMRFDPKKVPLCFGTECLPGRGEVHVYFVSYEHWLDIVKHAVETKSGKEELERLGGIAVALPRHPKLPAELHMGLVLIDSEKITEAGYSVPWLIVHELMHVLGQNHPDARRFPHTIMNHEAPPRPPNYLYPLDVAVLQTVYGEQ